MTRNPTRERQLDKAIFFGTILGWALSATVLSTLGFVAIHCAHMLMK